MQDFEDYVNEQSKVVSQLFHSGMYLKSFSRTTDAFRISKDLCSAQLRWRQLVRTVCIQRNVLDSALQDSKQVFLVIYKISATGFINWTVSVTMPVHNAFLM